ncbi:hypothetical protein [Legionella oakridgensis]|uniref:Uncharacterized protein n=1 Tax=Legionella oakridgensis TaxID=29423 RepID=A0A0W0WY38_9GAMM|nr:hypothetical protein [Legionella oakridgensis]KTD37231.1 hypothetical protein Loak_2367 [Legionella oakridgensis]STY16183.1 Uncharacterised protein [Legionella longbeachae]
MKCLRGVTVYYWSANHIALNITQADHIYEDGKFSAEYDEDGKLVHADKFRALTHNSDPELRCTSNHTPEALKDLINAWFDNKKKKIPSLIEDFWEDCSLYIREDQVELLKSLYQIMLEHHAFDDDEDLEDGYDDDHLPDNIEVLRHAGIDTTTGSEKRVESLIKAEAYEALRPLIEKLREDKTALEKKYIILDFVEQLKTQKGLGIDVEGTDEDMMYGKLPLKEWVLPSGNSLTLDDKDNDYLEHLNLFGLNVKGIEKGIEKFEDPESIVHRGFKETYYKFFSRYHNCAGYSRFLLEQGGITAFCSTNELEKFGVTDPSLYDAYMAKVQTKIAELNEKARDLMRNAGIAPKPLIALDTNYLAQFKKGEPTFDELPRAVRNVIDEYNKELADVSYEHKIKLLANLVSTLHSHDIKQPEVIDALQKEVRRNYEINFDAQFSHNHSFQLKCLGALATISVGALAVGILAIAFPPLIPITLAAAIVITAVAGATLAISIGLFAKKMQPQRPSTEHNMTETQDVGADML